MWKEDIPCITHNGIKVTVYAGKIEDIIAPSPPPNSWASHPQSDLAIWSISLPPNSSFELPPAQKGSNRTLYFFRGERLRIDQQQLPKGIGIRLHPERAVLIENTMVEAEILMLQGQPINQPVAKHGPFVMNTRNEIRQAIIDYQKTGFGGWPWPRKDPVHHPQKGRFAVHADGKTEIRES